jgi:hypothetical protein
MSVPVTARIKAIRTMLLQVMIVFIKILAVIGNVFLFSLLVMNQPATNGWIQKVIMTSIRIPKTEIRAIEFRAGCLAVNKAATPNKVVAEDKMMDTLYVETLCVRYL